MRFSIIFYTLISLSSFAQVFELPKEWSRGFQISAYYGGGQLSENKHVIFTYDSCKFIYEDGSKKVVTNYLVNPDDHDEILAKLNKLKAGNISTTPLKKPGKDKEIMWICFKLVNTEFCIENSENSKVSKADEGNFITANSYLIQFGTLLGMEH